MAITATFATGILTVIGDSLDNSITAGRNAAGTILVNGGAVSVEGGTPTVANTSLIQIFGQSGNDVISLDESNGALPAANLFGGDGNDTVTGGSGADMLFGQAGNDTLNARGGNDFLFGGDGNDTLIGGAGDDQVFGQAGDDRMIWNPGDGTDLFEGGDGIDTAEVNGGNGSETFTITANGSRVRFDRTSPAPFSLDIGTTENLVINANGGDDVITAGNGLAGLISLTIDGGAGNDTIIGGDGDDRLLGGDGNDTITGGRGSDVALLGAGNDTFIWNPGDGSDTVEGQDGFDTLVFNGANVNENITISANGQRVRLSRDVGTVTMDLDGVERIDVHALGGADHIVINDLTGTSLPAGGVLVDLAGTLGGTTGDGQVDSVTANGTAGDDAIRVFSFTTGEFAGGVGITGTPAGIVVTHQDAFDQLTVSGGAGNDTIDASAVLAGAMALTIDGGAGNDTIIGSQGDDLLIGGDGNDTITGGRGSDVALLGAGNDTFIWNPGDGSDTVEGQDGFDTLVFNGANANENITISANGPRVLLSRDVGTVTMDLDGVERIDVHALGGADHIVINDLTGTDLTPGGVLVDLAGTLGGTTGDGQVDTVTANGTAGDDAIRLFSFTSGEFAGGIGITGTPAGIVVTHQDAFDQLTVNGGAGNDVIDASGVLAGTMALTINGGAGNDLIVGSQGNDTVVGGQGNDTALLGAGNDTFVWNPGDGSDIVEGQSGFDTLVFNGANANENITISANGSRVLMTRDVGTVTMDLDGVERIDVHALGGADHVVINDLSGTDLTPGGVLVDLAGTLGGSSSDGQFDTVTANGSAGNDAIRLFSFATGEFAGGIGIAGTPAGIVVTHQDAFDQLTVNGGAGNDTIDASQVTPNAMTLTLNGGAGNDTLTGSGGADQFVFAFGSGNDTITNYNEAQGDVINLQGSGITSFAQLQALMVDHGTFTTIDLGNGGSLTLTGLHVAQLHANDFLFT
jgi:Ca2+-binding RTX toxin-like protein